MLIIPSWGKFSVASLARRNLSSIIRKVYNLTSSFISLPSSATESIDEK